MSRACYGVFCSYSGQKCFGRRLTSVLFKAKGETGEVQRLLHQLQGIRVGPLKIADQDSKRLLTQVPPKLNTVLSQLGLLPLFSQPPAWAEASPEKIRRGILLRGEFF